jgi:hypothetical protein
MPYRGRAGAAAQGADRHRAAGDAAPIVARVFGDRLPDPQ